MPNRPPQISKTVLVRNLQKESLMQCLHDIQSPLSGSSGYLELMQICLNGDKDLFKIARYRNKIQEGLEELEKILVQMSYIYKGEVKGDELLLIEFDLNWLVNDICVNLSALAKKRSQSILFKNRSQSVLIKSDMIVLKLLLYNLILSVLRVAAKEENIEIAVKRTNHTVELKIHVDEIVRPLDEVLEPFIESAKSASPDDSETVTHYGVQAVHFLNGSIQAVKFKEMGAEILFNLPLEAS